MKPTMAAKKAPTTRARTIRARSLGMADWRLMAAMMPEKAPTLIKPAWPRDSSPRMPTVRFREMDMHT